MKNRFFKIDFSTLTYIYKMRYLYIILVTTFISAQNNIVKYSAIQIEENEFQKNLPLDTKKIFEAADKLVEKIKIELVFNDSISVFKLEDGYGPNSYEERIAITKAGLSVPKFMDLKQNKSFYNNKGNPILGEKEFLVYDTLDFNWKIINEEKLIDAFRVIKAVGTANKHERIVTVIAWFAPELPFRHGPYGIGNLPGLILEMQIGTTLYVAREIILKNNTDYIEIPKKGKLIFIQDYYKLCKERYDDVKK